MISSSTISSITTSQPRQNVLGIIYTRDLGSPTLDRVLAERRESTEAERMQIHEETKDVLWALVGFRDAGVADPLTAAREAVAKTRAKAFGSRDDALGQVVRSFDTLLRGADDVSASMRSIGAAESVRDGASPERLAAINHVVSQNTGYINRLNGRMAVAAAMLERDFTVTGSVLERGADGRLRHGAFEISHTDHGRLMSVDDRGNVTLYGQNGASLDAGAYAAALFGSAGPFAPGTSLVNRLL